MYRLIGILFAVFLFALPAHAQTRVWISHGTFESYGTPSPIAATDYLYPYQISFPNCFAINSLSNPPWDPNGVGGVAHYVTATNATTCAGGGSPNPGQGIYLKLNAPHRALGIIQWVRLNGNITTSTFTHRFNDCTHAATTGVYRGCIDNSALLLTTANKFQGMTGAGSLSAALTLGTWAQIEWCYIAGTNGSGTVPSKESAWLNQVNFISNATPATTSPGLADNGITFDYELGAGGTMDFGPFAVYDSGTACPASALGTMYAVAYQPTANGSHQDFTPNANANWQNAAAATPGSASYNSDATAGTYDIYNMTLGTHSGILFVAQRASVEKTGGGTRIAQLGWNISGTKYQCSFSNGFSLGADTLGIYISNSLQLGTYQQIDCLAPNDPSTSSAWSGAGSANKITATVIR